MQMQMTTPATTTHNKMPMMTPTPMPSSLVPDVVVTEAPAVLDLWNKALGLNTEQHHIEFARNVSALAY